MSFDVPKVVRSPECDYGHDEESRNGRDIKIDILEAYIWTSEEFRVKSGFYRSAGGVTGTPRGLMGLVGPCRCQNRRISGRGSRTVRLGQMVT